VVIFIAFLVGIVNAFDVPIRQAFLVQMVGSAVHLNHWILDVSILQHIALAPAVAPDWQVAWWYAGLGLVLALLAAWRFNRRDLQNE